MSFFVKILGIVDLIAALMLFCANTELFSHRWIVYLAAALFIKGILFIADPVSKFDCILALYLALTIVFNVTALSILFGIYLAFKGIYSFF